MPTCGRQRRRRRRTALLGTRRLDYIWVTCCQCCGTLGGEIRLLFARYSGYCVVHAHHRAGRPCGAPSLRNCTMPFVARPASGRATQASAWPDRPRILRAAQKFSFSRRQFSRVTLFFQPIHWPHRELQNRENRILKLHTNLEIFASNPILKTHFFELGELCICKKSYILWSAICSMKRHKFWPARFRGKVLKSCQRDPYQNCCHHLAENFLGKPKFFCIRHMGTVEP